VQQRRNIPAVQAYDSLTGKDIVTEALSVRTSKKKRQMEADKADATEDDGESDWMRLRSLGKHHMKKMGDPVQCISATFTVSKKYRKKFEFHESLDVGKIAGNTSIL
jgi:hypothetical protein